MKIPQGPPGQKGDPGNCICNATALMSSFTMPKMIQGPKGETGVPGQEGKQGLMGLTVRILILRFSDLTKALKYVFKLLMINFNITSLHIKRRLTVQ